MNFLKWFITNVVNQIRLFGKAVWHLIKMDTRADRRYKTRAFIFLCCWVSSVVGIYLITEKVSEYSVNCPSYEELQFGKGLLVPYDTRFDHDLLLIRDDAVQVKLMRERTLSKVINKKWLDENKKRPVTVYWFITPSGKGWITELNIENEKVVSYDERCRDILEMRQRIEGSYQIPFMLMLVALLIVILEMKALKNTYYRGENR